MGGKEFSDFVFTDIVASLKNKISSVHFPAPTYSPVAHAIKFAGIDIKIPPNSDQDALCRVLFKDARSLNREWSWDEVMELWGDPVDNKDAWRRVYNAGREINFKVSAETTVKDLLLVRKLSVAANPRFLK